MQSIEKQKEYLDKLYNLMRDSLPENYETASCWFDYLHFDDGSMSIGSKLSYEYNGKIEYGMLNYPDVRIVDEVIPDLHSEMKIHTGGDWESFLLTINKDGSVTAKFKYRNS